MQLGLFLHRRCIKKVPVAVMMVWAVFPSDPCGLVRAQEVQAVKDSQTGAFAPPAIAPNHRLGVAHMLPRYRPGGVLGPDILVAGAQDAYALGFRTIKVALNGEVLQPNLRYYSIPAEQLAGVRTLVELAELPPYRALFDLPFQTFILAADPIGPGNWGELRGVPSEAGPEVTDRPWDEGQRRNLYDQMKALAALLLDRYRGTGKVFILQNHEADWRVLPRADAGLAPSPTALENARTYFELRQRAVDDARLASDATGVYVYHMAEVNLVEKAMRGGRTVTNDVLPAIRPDLVGYSAWDLAGKPAALLDAIAFLRSRANDGAAFGDNNVVISEIGAPERLDPASVGPVVDAMLASYVDGARWVIHWNLYDNECAAEVGGNRELIDNATEGQCSGFWVRKPDGTLGRVFSAYRTALDPGSTIDPMPTDPAAMADAIYRATLGRAAEPAVLEGARAMVDRAPWDASRLWTQVVTSPEYRSRTADSSAAVILDTYRVVLGRLPEASIARTMVEARLTDDASRQQYVAQVLGSTEAHRRFVTWLFQRYAGRPPTEPERDAWVSLLDSGTPRAALTVLFLRQSRTIP